MPAVPAARAASAELEVLLLAVSYPTPDGSRTDVVQVPLSIRREPLPGAEPALIGQLSDAGPAGPAADGTAAPGALWIYDGVHDPEFIAAWLELMRHGGTTPSGNATGHLVESGYRLPRATGVVKVLSGEQSNSSVIVDDGESAAILKFFRVLSEGQNPEVEIGAALTAGRTAEVPATLGWVTGEWAEAPAGDARTPGPARGELAVAHEFLAGGLDAWRLAVDAASERTGFHRRGPRPRRRHRHGAPPAGRRHSASPSESVPGGDIAPGVAQRVRQSWAQAGTAVGPYGEALDGLLERLEGSGAGPLQRIHGDLHLGQILQVPGGAGKAPRWAILDFEGEPLRPISERNFPDVPLRDVVGMLRSFDYAAGAAVREHPDADVPGTWVDDCAEAFLAGYADVIPGSIDRDSPALRGAVARQGTLRSHLRTTEQARLALHSGPRITSSPRQYRLRRSRRSRSGRYQNDRFSTYRSSRKSTARGRGHPGEGRRRRTPRAALGPGRAPR